mgnify:CR=1 FL=1
MSEELSKLTISRDNYRKLSLEYKEAAEKMDRQVNRLQHFIADYDVSDIITLTPKPNGDAQPKTRTGGVKEKVLECLELQDGIIVTDIKAYIRSCNLNPASVSSALGRLVNSGQIVMGEGRLYRLNGR